MCIECLGDILLRLSCSRLLAKGIAIVLPQCVVAPEHTERLETLAGDPSSLALAPPHSTALTIVDK